MADRLTYARMAAPSEVDGLKVVAFIADGASSGYALLDLQAAAEERHLASSWCVTHVGIEEGGTITRWGGRYRDNYPAALLVFSKLASEVWHDEFETVERMGPGVLGRGAKPQDNAEGRGE